MVTVGGRGFGDAPHPCPLSRGERGKQWLGCDEENRDLSEGEAAVWGYAGEAGMRLAGLWFLRRAGVIDLVLRYAGEWDSIFSMASWS